MWLVDAVAPLVIFLPQIFKGAAYIFEEDI